MAEDLIGLMVTRFLAWKLPDDFSPDAGIAFSPSDCTPASPHWPTGTNLMTAHQARQMVEYMLHEFLVYEMAPSDLAIDAARYRFLREADRIPISHKAARDPIAYDEAIDREMEMARGELAKDGGK